MTEAPQKSRPLVCEQCGTAFTCGSDGECWCAGESFRLPMPPPGSTADCLCPDCLCTKATRAG